MGLFSGKIEKRIAAYQQELIETHYREVENMYHQIRGWRHDYRNHIQTMKAYAANGDLEAIKQAYAAQTKRYHPEEHPEAFRALHDAYRQAVRYARQHPAASTLQKNTAASAPAAPAPAFKPSYHLPRPIDNPCRAPKYPSADDVFNAKQFEEIRRENKNFHHSEPCKHSVPSDELPHGKLPIRGSGTTPEPSDGLRFDVLDQTGDDCEAECPPAETSSAPAEIPTEAPTSPPETPVKKSHPFVKA